MSSRPNSRPEPTEGSAREWPTFITIGLSSACPCSCPATSEYHPETIWCCVGGFFFLSFVSVVVRLSFLFLRSLRSLSEEPPTNQSFHPIERHNTPHSQAIVTPLLICCNFLFLFPFSFRRSGCCLAHSAHELKDWYHRKLLTF